MAATTKVAKVCSYLSAKFNWTIKDFSKLDAQSGSCSDVFSVGRHKWKVGIYPKGAGKVYDHLSLYLCSVDLKKPVQAAYSMTVTSQFDPNKNVKSGERVGWSLDKFMTLSELHDPNKGYIGLFDTCEIEVEVTCRVDEKEDEYDPCRGGCIVTKAKQNH